MTNVRRRILTALFLVFLISAVMPVHAFAAGLSTEQESNMDAMGREVFIWFKAFRSCVIPLLIVRYASNGLKLIGNTVLTKGEYRLDGIKIDIFYSTLAAIILVLLPYILGWAMGLFQAGAWEPPAQSFPGGESGI